MQIIEYGLSVTSFGEFEKAKEYMLKSVDSSLIQLVYNDTYTNTCLMFCDMGLR